MMLTGQVFAIMSDTATKEQVKEIVAAADEYLFDETIGGYKLNTNFCEVKEDLGRMFGFAYGHKENGAVFSHMVVMFANALYQRGFVPEGYKAINTLYRHCSDFNKSKIYPGIPEYIGDNGRGLYHYLTGSASWLLLTVLTEMFGIKGDLGDLLLEPKLMLEQFDENLNAEAKLIFADRKLTVQYCNKNGKEYGKYRVGRITVDGVTYEKFSDKKVILRKDIETLKEALEHVITVELV
jgi:cellobiose phosphorylase